MHAYLRGYGLRYGDEADSASIHTLSRNHSGNVTVVVSFPGAAGTVWCAGDDVSGKMTGIQMKEAETGVHQYAFAFPGADTVRAFVLDEDLRPLCASKVADPIQEADVEARVGQISVAMSLEQKIRLVR